MKKIYLLLLVLSLTLIGYSQDTLRSPENIFLEDLRILVEQYKDQPMSEAFTLPIDDKKDYSQKKYQYGERLSSVHKSVIEFFKSYSNPAKEALDDKYSQIKNHFHPITPKEIYDYFSEMIIRKKFRFQTGDVILLLPHSEYSYHYAYLIDDAYSHGDILYIDPKDNVPYVMMLREGLKLQKIPLVKILLGMGDLMDRFAFYRYNKTIDQEELNYILYLTNRHSEKIYFDSWYFRDTKIFNPEKYFLKPRYYYCLEYIYMIYEYTLKGNAFDPHINYSMNLTISKGKTEITPMLKFLMLATETLEKENNQYMITSKTISGSKDFEMVASMGGTTPLNELYNEEIAPTS